MPKTLSHIVVIVSLGFLASCTSLSGPSTTPVPIVPPLVPSKTGAVLPIPVALTPFIARGTEPFWALEQTMTGAKFSRPEASGVTETWYTSVQTNSSGSISIVATPVSVGIPLSATLTTGTCSDGMSDIVYSYNASITIGTGTLSGCAN